MGYIFGSCASEGVLRIPHSKNSLSLLMVSKDSIEGHML
jgi:hypothetical protein